MASAVSAFSLLMSRISPFRDSRFSNPATISLAYTKRIMCNSSHIVSSSPSLSDISSSSPPPPFLLVETSENPRSRYMYYTHGKCRKGTSSAAADLEKNKSQEFNFFLVIDLEGKDEILEFPVLIVDAKTMEVVDLFHRFVRPTKMSEQAINKYIEVKYGELGVDRSMASSSDAWMREYNEALKLSEDINGMMAERNSSGLTGPDAQCRASAIRRKITILGTRLDTLQSLLVKVPGKQHVYVILNIVACKHRQTHVASPKHKSWYFSFALSQSLSW